MKFAHTQQNIKFKYFSLFLKRNKIRGFWRHYTHSELYNRNSSLRSPLLGRAIALSVFLRKGKGEQRIARIEQHPMQLCGVRWSTPGACRTRDWGTRDFHFESSAHAVDAWPGAP